MNTIIKRTWNQNRMVTIEDLRGMAFQAESGGHTFEISGINDANEAVSLSGTVAGVFMRPDGADVALTGAASDGVVSVTLSDACYAVAGRFGLYIFVTSDSKKTCVYACIGTVAQTSYGTVAGDTPQDVVDLINAINAAIASIPADYSDLLDSIAPSFSDSTEYASGTIVWYDGVLYQFTADKATGSWDATKVRQISVATARFNTANFEDGAVTLPKLGADVVEELDTKADTDGSYESMTVGNAEQLISSVGITDQTPYNFRTSGGSTEIGDREELNAVVGGTVAWNQLLKEMNSTNYMATAAGTTASISDGVATVTAGSKYNGIICASANRPSIPTGRKVLGMTMVKLTTAVANAIVMNTQNSGNVVAEATTDWQRLANIWNWDSTKIAAMRVVDFRSTGFDAFQVKNCMLIDLTLLLGSTIANYIYALEQSNAGSGVAYFRKLFPKSYYAYNSGELLSVRTNLHRMVGFNQWDEEWESGGLPNGVPDSTVNKIRSKNYCRCVENTVYYGRISGTYSLTAWFYDANNNVIGSASASNRTFTTPNSACYFKLAFESGYGTSYNDDVCINLSWDGERDGEYEPYQEWNYPLDSSLTLRGILKLDANNNLYADGDRYLPDGTVERRFAERAYQSGDESLADAITDGTTTVYKLTTPTTETADPYTQTQIVDDFGTEEFVDAAVEAGERDVAIPVGNETVYKQNLRAKLEMAPDSPDGDGDYIVRRTNGQNSYIPLVEVKELPDMPSEDGNYTLRCTVTNGTATLSWVSA